MQIPCKHIDVSIKPVPGIYAIKSKIDNRIYIGMSSKVRKRLIAHIRDLNQRIHKNPSLQFFYNKYGIEQLEFVLIEYCLKEELVDREYYWIKHYNSCTDGFNHTDGGYTFPMSYPGAVEKCLKTRTKRGTDVYIYAYSVKTGELIYADYTYKKMKERFGVDSALVANCMSGAIKTTHGVHFSRTPKTIEQVLKDVIPNYLKPEHRKKISEMTSGSKNPMFGKKRPDCTGDNNHMRKQILNGVDFHIPKKLQITESEIVRLHHFGISTKEIAKQAGCGTCNISLLLRRNGIFLGKDWKNKNKKVFKAA